MSPVPDQSAQDFTDPARCAEECRVVAGGVTQLAEACESGGALATHRPAYFYHRVAALLLAAAEHCRSAAITEDGEQPAKAPQTPATQPEPVKEKQSGGGRK